MAAARDADDEASPAVEQYRELIADGAFADAIDMCRRLLRAESNVQRVETAHLVLDRLRSNKSDSDDDVNALLRLLSNHVSPTRELTDDMLSLLFFSDHRVLVIHHLSKLTYQSKECVKLVVEAYLELLSSDRSLLVPILGSLADLPLDSADKSLVLDATECLLDAAVEEDVPTVVQSLLSMVTAATAPRIAAKLRAECNRVNSGTLCLTFEVIGRFAVTGSVTLNALLSVIRNTDALMSFDILLLTYLMGKSTENEIAIKTSSFLAHRGRFQKSVLHETLHKLVQQEWRSLLPSFIRFCSFLLAVCFQDMTSSSLALRFIPIAVDCLGFLIESRTAVHEEALTLLFTVSSQPKKLLMLATSRTAQRTRGFLCWKIAEAVALRLAALARSSNKVLAPYAHLFLDHLHSIASTTNDSGDSSIGSYPSHVIDTLCCTMVALTKQERGVFSLLMITIQKQLVSRVGVSGIGQGQQTLHLRNQNSPSRSVAAATHVKQLMALFLAGHLLKSRIALEERDRKSLVSWILRLLSTAADEEILLHAMRLVREGMTESSSSFMTNVTSQEEQSHCASLISQVFRKKSLIVSERNGILVKQREGDDDALAYDQLEFEDPLKNGELSSPLIVNLTEFARKMQAEITTIGKSNHCGGDSNKDSSQVLSLEDTLEREYLKKFNLLRELYHSYVAFSSPKLQERILDGGFLFPSLYQSLVSGEISADVDPKALGSLIWNIACGLDVAVTSANEIGTQLVCVTSDKQELVKYQARLSSRLKICLDLHGQLERAIVVQKGTLQAREGRYKEESGAAGSPNRRVELEGVEGLRCQCVVAERLVNGQARRGTEELPGASLYGVELRTLCLFFEIHWKKRAEHVIPLTHELELLRVLCSHLRSNGGDHAKLSARAGNGTNDGVSVGKDVSFSTEIKRILLHSSEGRRTLKYLASRAGELSETMNAASKDDADSESDGEQDSDGVRSKDSIVKELATCSLMCIYSLFTQILEKCGEPEAFDNCGTWDDKVIELFATGCNREDSLANANDARGYLEVFYQFLLHECLKMKDPQLACALIDILVMLTMRTRKQRVISHLCMMMLRQPFPSGFATPGLSLRDTDFVRVPGEGLPTQSLPHLAASLRGAGQCSLTKYRCSSQKWRHLVYFTVGSWAFASNASSRYAIMGFYLDAMKALVDSMAPKDSGRKTADSTEAAESEAEEEDSDEEMREALAVLDGEHLSLTSLTITTFPFFFDSMMLCSIASLSCASPKTSRGGGSNSEREVSPFADICDALAVVHNALMLYVEAESAGFDLPVKTNLLVLRGASHMLKLVKQVLKRCISWRAEQTENDEWGALHHLEDLFQFSNQVRTAMDNVLGSFQERVALKMQQNGRLVSKEKSSASGKGRWKSTLLGKTYGKKYRKRRWISKSEAKLLPYFSHGVEELKDFIEHQSDVNNLELSEPASDTWVPLFSTSTDTDLFQRSGSVIESELINGNLSDWSLGLVWDWNDDGDDEEEGSGIDEDDESDDDEADKQLETEEPIAVIMHTPQVRRKARPESSKRTGAYQTQGQLEKAVGFMDGRHKKQKQSRNA